MEKDLKKGVISIKNRFDFTNVDEYDLAWELIKNGEKTASGTFATSLPPHQKKDIKLNIPAIPSDGNEYSLNLYAYTRTATDLVLAKHEVAREQFKLGKSSFFEHLDKVEGTLNYTEEEEEGTLSFTSGAISGKFDLKKGIFYNYKINGIQPIRAVQYPEPAFWRVPIDNDFGNKCCTIEGFGEQPMSTNGSRK